MSSKVTDDRKWWSMMYAVDHERGESVLHTIYIEFIHLQDFLCYVAHKNSKMCKRYSTKNILKNITCKEKSPAYSTRLYVPLNFHSTTYFY